MGYKVELLQQIYTQGNYRLIKLFKQSEIYFYEP